MTTESGSGDADIGFLVPVSNSPTLGATVEYAAHEAREVAAETDDDVGFVLVAPAPERGPPSATDRSDAKRLLDEAASVAADALDVTDPAGSVDVETVVLDLERYPVDFVEYVDAIAAFVREREIETVVVDPDHRMPVETPIGRSFETQLRDVGGEFDLEVAPVKRPSRRSRLVTRGGLAQFLTIVGLSFGFYVVIGGLEEPVFDVVTGAATAVLVAAVLSRITFERTPRAMWLLRTVGRWLLYTPYLLWKVAVANLQIAYVVLHPSLPIDPSIERFEAGVWGGTATATLANSITLTPGTLTVDVRNGEFVVHALTTGARDDLLDGSLERAVRFVFYGRSGLRYPSPRERLGAGSSGEESVAADVDTADAAGGSS